MIGAKEETATEKAVVTNAAGTFETDIEITYCTEFIVVKSDVNKDSTKLRAFLESPLTYMLLYMLHCSVLSSTPP